MTVGTKNSPTNGKIIGEKAAFVPARRQPACGRSATGTTIVVVVISRRIEERDEGVGLVPLRHPLRSPKKFFFSLPPPDATNRRNSQTLYVANSSWNPDSWFFLFDSFFEFL
jgi:hypothetical protein